MCYSGFMVVSHCSSHHFLNAWHTVLSSVSLKIPAGYEKDRLKEMKQTTVCRSLMVFAKMCPEQLKMDYTIKNKGSLLMVT